LLILFFFNIDFDPEDLNPLLDQGTKSTQI